MTQQSVADDVLGRFARQQHGWFERIRKGSLDPEDVMRAVQAVIDRPRFSRDMRKEGWKLLDDVAEPAEISIGDLKLVSFLNDDETYVLGEEMRKRARNMGAMLGQRHAEHLLEHQEEIPAEWQDHYLVFPGTVWRDRDGYLRVSSLYWNGDRWILDFRWLAHRFDSPARLVRSRK